MARTASQHLRTGMDNIAVSYKLLKRVIRWSTVFLFSAVRFGGYSYHMAVEQNGINNHTCRIPKDQRRH